MNIEFAQEQDINSWMDLLNLVKDSFPGLDIPEYKAALLKCILNKEAIVGKMGNTVVGALSFSYSNAELNFLAVHPQYQKKGIAQELILKLTSLFSEGTELSVITYREGDSQGIYARKLYQRMGFCYGELLTMFDYPCQRMIYTVKG